MAQISVVAIYTALAVLAIGSLPCTTAQCNNQGINSCFIKTHNDNGSCKFYRDIVACLKTLKTNCSDDSSTSIIAENIAYYSAEIEQCKGLPDGSCFADAFLACQRDIPFHVKTLVNIKEEDKKKDCKEFEGKEEKAKNCLKSLGTSCASPRIAKSMDFVVKEVEEVEKICSDVKNSQE